MATEVKFSTRYVPACSWRGAGYMVSVVGGPQDLVCGGTEESAIEYCRTYFAENYEVAPVGEATPNCGIYRPRR